MEILIGAKLVKDATDARMRVGMDKLSICTLSRKAREYATKLEAQAGEIQGLKESLGQARSDLESKSTTNAELRANEDNMGTFPICS